jgi:effector-binding domain-containing protein
MAVQGLTLTPCEGRPNYVMFSIGEFARHGRISVRMLHHYDAIGLLRLAEVGRAAAIIHHGSMDDVLSTGQALARWIDANGYRSAGYAREVTLEWSPDPDQWVTELQQPIYATGG